MNLVQGCLYVGQLGGFMGILFLFGGYFLLLVDGCWRCIIYIIGNNYDYDYDYGNGYGNDWI